MPCAAARCEVAEHADLLALAATWDGLRACVEALDADDEEVRGALLAGISAKEPARKPPVWASESWTRAGAAPDGGLAGRGPGEKVDALRP